MCYIVTSRYSNCPALGLPVDSFRVFWPLFLEGHVLFSMLCWLPAGSLITLLASHLAWLCTWVCDSGQGARFSFGPDACRKRQSGSHRSHSSRTKVMGTLALRNRFTCGVVWQTLHA